MGSITILLGTADGFGPPRVFRGGAMFAISVADFDRDGNDGRGRGSLGLQDHVLPGRRTGQGDVEPAYEVPVPFVNESRVMVTRDFDGDGDLDIAGAGYDGDMVVLENRGAATAASWGRVSTRHRCGTSIMPASPSA